MLEPPSEQLQKILAEYRLCTRGDLRRCRPRVRRLAHDLPAFDSVWIDALVQAGRLTSFQARVLESPNPESLRVGPCILVDLLGRGRSGATYLARHIDSSERCVLKRMTLSPEDFSTAAERLSQLVSSCQELTHPSLVVPHVCKQMAPEAGERRSWKTATPLEPGEVILISRFVPGLTLKELLIRRGRFPPDVVWEIGRQLLDGLAAFEERGFVHGEIVLTNVRLSGRGVAALVDAGVLPAVRPELSIHEAVSPDRCDGIAPERIGTGTPPTVRSDLYALGCLLWTLLAGRPPFPSGDSLAKLAAHQTRPIPDIREWSPTTPDRLARLITHLAAQDPTERPASVREAQQLWGRPGRWGQQRVRRFRAQFDSGVPKVPPPASHRTPGRWTVLVVLVFVLSGAVLSFVDQGARAHLLKLAARVSDTWHRGTRSLLPLGGSSGTNRGSDKAGRGGAAGADRRGGDQLVPLPPPSAEGVILLDSDGPYKVADISSAGPLVLRGADGRHPLVVITDEPLRIWAQQVVLENIRFVTQEATPTRIAHGLSSTKNRATHPAKAGRRPAALLLVRSQSFAVEHCVFQTHRVIPPTTTAPASADKSITTLPQNGAGGSHAPGDNQNSETGRSHADRPEGPSSTDEELPVAWGAAGPPVAVAWKPLDAAEPMGRIVSFHNTVFVGQSTAVYLGGAAQHVSAGNCLKLGAGQMFDAAAEALAGRTLRLALEHCTLRDAGALLRLIWPTVADRKWPSPESASFQITINATDCVLDIDAAQAALLEWLGPPTEAAWLASVEVRGGGSLIRPELALAAAVELPSGRRRDLDGSRLAVEGLMAPTYRFAGPIRLDWAQSTLSFCDAPRTAALPPGIDASQLPAWPAGVARSGEPVREK